VTRAPTSSKHRPYKSPAIVLKKGSRHRYTTFIFLLKLSLFSFLQDYFSFVTNLSIEGSSQEENPASLLTFLCCGQFLHKHCIHSFRRPAYRRREDTLENLFGSLWRSSSWAQLPSEGTLQKHQTGRPLPARPFPITSQPLWSPFRSILREEPFRRVGLQGCYPLNLHFSQAAYRRPLRKNSSEALLRKPI